MKFLVTGINYAPECVGTGKYTSEMCEWLAREGHDVRVVAAPPYYPAWKLWPGFNRFWFGRERRDGVDVVRCPIWVPAVPRGIWRLLHLCSFAVSSLAAMLWSLAWRPDVVVCVAPTLANAPVAWVVARFCGASSWLHVQDFEVDAAFGMGLVRSEPLRRIAIAVERWLLRRFDVVSSISRQMLQRLDAKGVPVARRYLFRNWVDTSAIQPLDDPSTYRAELDIPDDSVVVMYSGTMGLKQGLDLLAETAKRLAGAPGIYFVFGGEGPGKIRLERACTGLTNIRFAGFQPGERLNEWLGLADIHVMPQLADVSDLVLPSKLTGMLASGRPIVAVAPMGSGVAEAIDACGVTTPPGDVEAFSAALLKLAADASLRSRLGRCARELAVALLDKQVVLRGFEDRALELGVKQRLSEFDEAA